MIHSVATTPGQTAAINDFIAKLCRENPNVSGFAHTSTPTRRTWPGRIERALDMGLAGVKIHSDNAARGAGRSQALSTL